MVKMNPICFNYIFKSCRQLASLGMRLPDSTVIFLQIYDPYFHLTECHVAEVAIVSCSQRIAKRRKHL